MGFDGLSQSLKDRGFRLHDEILSEEDADEPPIEVLSLDGSKRWWTITRLRSLVEDAATVPLCLECDAFDLEVCADAIDLFHKSGSAAAVLERCYGYGLRSCDVATRAVAADAESAARLKVKPGHPLLAMERINRGADGRPVHVVQFLMRTDVVPVVESLVNPSVS